MDGNNNQAAAKNDLQSAEANASAEVATSDAITAEESGGLYTGTGRVDPSSDKKAKSKGIFKKGGPISIILVTLALTGTLMLGGQASQPFALVNNLLQNYNSSSYSTTARINTLIRKAVKKTGGEKTKNTPELENSLKQAGIDVEADADGNIESLQYKNKSGEIVKVTGDNVDSELTGDFGDRVAKAGEFIDTTSTYESKTKTMAADRIDWEKNRYSEYDSETKTESDELDFKEIARGDTGDDVKITTEEEVSKQDTDEDGNLKYDDDGNPIMKTDIEESDTSVKTKADADVEATKVDIGNIAKKAASGASTAVCAYSAAATAVAAITMGQQMMEMINMTSGYMESVQKVQAGDGTGASLHQYNNETNQVNDEGKGFWTSTSISSLFGGDTGDSTAGVANLENIVTANSALTIGTDAATWKTCIGLKLAANAVDVIGDIIGIFTAGIGKAIQIGVSLAISAGGAIIASTIIEAIVQSAVKSLSVDVITDMGSEEAGDYTVGGGDLILSAMGRSTGLSAGTSAKVAEFEAYKNSVIAQRAQYDRDNLSPFDTSSQYTFLGSLVHSATSFAVLSSGHPLTKAVSSISSVLSNSIITLLPKTSAVTYSSIVNRNSTEDTCPLLSSVDATGTTLHCGYNSISDTSTYGITYQEAVDYLCRTGNLENCGSTPTIVKNSELAKYVTFWTTRDSHLGLADSGITNSLHMLEASTGSGTADAAINGAVGAVPVIGGAIDIMNAANDAANFEYIYGSAYVAGGSEWDEEKQYIQTYLELDTIYSDLALIETSALATYLEDYYEENPLDKSYEGTLARYSGLTKDEVISTLAYMDYLEYVAKYDASSRYAFSDTTNSGAYDFSEKIFIKNTLAYSTFAKSTENIIYFDLRSRTTQTA